MEMVTGETPSYRFISFFLFMFCCHIAIVMEQMD